MHNKSVNSPKLRLRLLMIVLLPLLSLKISAQTNSLVFHHLNKEKGFSQSVCNDVFKDSRGFIWISTISGLFRFDVAEFVDVTSGNQKLKGHWLSDIVEDSKGNLWLSKHDDELVQYDRDRNSFTLISLGAQLFQQKLVTNFIEILHMDEFDRIWFLHNARDLGVYDTESGKVTLVYKNTGVGEKLHIYFDTINILRSAVFLKDNQLHRMLRGQIDSTLNLAWIDHKPAAFDFNRFSVLPDDKNIWFIQSGQLLHYDWNLGRLETFVLEGESLPGEENSRYLIQDQNQRLWIRTSRGLCSFDLKKKIFLNNFIHDASDQFGISPAATPILCDNDNVLWMAPWGRGVDYCNLESFRFNHVMTTESSAKKGINNFIRAMVSDEKGNVYASVENSGVVLLNENGDYLKTVSTQDPNAFECLHRDRSGKIWIGSNSLQGYDPVKGVTDYINFTNKNIRISAILERADGKLLLGTYDNILLYDRTKKTVKEVKGIQGRSAYGLLYEFENADLLAFQKDHGISLYKNSGSDYKLDKVIDSKLYVKSVLRIAPDTLWMATTTGIFAYIVSKKEVTTIGNLNDKLPNQYVYSILKGTKGYYWASTNSGLFRWQPGTGSYKSFGKEFGLQDVEFNTNAYCSLKNGDLMFGGVNGINVIPSNVPDHFTIPGPNLQIISINSDTVIRVARIRNAAYSELSIPAGNSSIEIEYNSIDLFNPEKIKVRYRLKNYNDEWFTSDRAGIARFVNIKPGAYIFEIQVANADGNWLENVQQLNIHFQSFWWQSAWFKIMLGLMFLLATTYVVRLFLDNRLQKERQTLENKLVVQNERERIMSELHDDIGATLSSMNIYGDLAGDVWDSKPQESRKIVEKISDTAKDLMSRMGDIIWSMKPADEERYTLEPRLRNYSSELLSPKNILCDFDIDEKLASSITNPNLRKHLLLIVKEALNNIAKYSDATKATVVFQKQDDIALLTISDNGKGFEPGKVTQGNGLKNILQRSKLLGGSCSVKTIPGDGTDVTCNFPIAIISHAM